MYHLKQSLIDDFNVETISLFQMIMPVMSYVSLVREESLFTKGPLTILMHL